MRRFTTAAVFAGALVLGLGTGASAQDTAEDLELTAEQKADLDVRAADVLDNSKPGGERIAPDKIAWDDGDVVLTLAVDGKPRQDVEAEGLVKLFDGMHFNGDKLEFYSCEFRKLRDYNFTNRTSSWMNNQYGDAFAILYWWDGERSRWLDWGYPPHTEQWGSYDREDDKADFLKVC